MLGALLNKYMLFHYYVFLFFRVNFLIDAKNGLICGNIVNFNPVLVCGPIDFCFQRTSGWKSTASARCHQLGAINLLLLTVVYMFALSPLVVLYHVQCLPRFWRFTSSDVYNQKVWCCLHLMKSLTYSTL